MKRSISQQTTVSALVSDSKAYSECEHARTHTHVSGRSCSRCPCVFAIDELHSIHDKCCIMRTLCGWHHTHLHRDHLRQWGTDPVEVNVGKQPQIRSYSEPVPVERCGERCRLESDLHGIMWGGADRRTGPPSILQRHAGW